MMFLYVHLVGQRQLSQRMTIMQLQYYSPCPKLEGDLCLCRGVSGVGIQAEVGATSREGHSHSDWTLVVRATIFHHEGKVSTGYQRNGSVSSLNVVDARHRTGLQPSGLYICKARRERREP